MKIKKGYIGIFCLVLLFVGSTILPSIGGRYADDVKEPMQTRNDTEKGLVFYFAVGLLKDVKINETFGWHEGVVVNGVSGIFIPKISLIPGIFSMKGEIYLLSESLPVFHTRILFLPNNQILFSEWLLFMTDIEPPENTRHFFSYIFSLDELV
jgi:hypothetical protein